MASTVPGMTAEEHERNTNRGGDQDRPTVMATGEPIVLTAISTALGMLAIVVTIFWGSNGATCGGRAKWAIERTGPTRRTYGTSFIISHDAAEA
jgi:hypothetical protein